METAQMFVKIDNLFRVWACNVFGLFEIIQQLLQS